MTGMDYVQYMENIERLGKQIADTLRFCETIEHKLDVLLVATTIAAPSLDESEVQSYLCDLATALEVAAGRAGPGDMAWVSIDIKSISERAES